MKICHVTSVHPPEDGRIFRRECIALANHGYDVYLVQQGKSYEKDGVHIVGFGRASKSRSQRLFSDDKRAIRCARKVDADVYHLHDPELLRYAAGLKKDGKKVIFDSHENYKEQIKIKTYLSKPIAAVLSYMYSKYELSVLNRIDGVVIPCTINGRFWLNTKCPNKVISNNLPWLKEIISDSDKYRENSGICMVGSLTEARGVTQIVHAANEAGVECKLAGPIQQEYLEELKTYDKSHRVRYFGVLKHSDSVKLIKNTSIGLSTLLNIGQYGITDNFPTKVYEYMGCGIPVILSRSDYNEAMVKKYNFGVCVDPQNIKEFAKVIRELIEDPKTAREMGKNGKIAVLERFNWDKEQDTLIALYKKLETEMKKG